MSDERITKMPVPASSHHVTTAVTPPPVVAGPDDPALSTGPPEPVWLFGRVLGTAIVAAAFVFVCWLLGGSVYAEPRMLSGPLWLFHTWGGAGPVIAIAMMAVLLPCIFAVGVWPNKATIALSILGCLAWVAISFWIEMEASI